MIASFNNEHAWFHVKLLPSQCTFCVHHTVMHQFTVFLSFEARVHACV